MVEESSNKIVAYLFFGASFLGVIYAFAHYTVFGAQSVSSLTFVRVFLPVILAFGILRNKQSFYFISVAICGIVAISSFWDVIELTFSARTVTLNFTEFVASILSLAIAAAILVLLQFCEFGSIER